MYDVAEIRLLIETGALDRARDRLTKRLYQRPNDVAALRLRAETGFRKGDREAGFGDAMQAVRMDPADVSFGLDCAYNLLRAGRRDDALAIATLVAEQSPTLVDHRDALGTVFTHCERPELALKHFEYACRHAPGRPLLWHNLASAQRMVGDKIAAEESLNTAIRLDGKDGKSYLARSQLRRQSTLNNHVAQIEQALADADDPSERILLGYALAKELEDLGRFPESFQHLSRAATSHRQRLRHNGADELSMLRDLRRLEYPAVQATETAKDTDGPIFIMGLPRSGTTLVERIIASSGQVQSAGEPNTLEAEVWRAADRADRSASRAETLVRTMGKKGRLIAEAYMKLLAHRFQGSRFTDKTPGNYLFAGLIKSFMPGARMICLRRDPVDTCYALYKTLLFGAYDFSYDLSELADYYIEWTKLINHWEQSLGDSWMTINYEDLIRNPEHTMRRIIDHCGLVWTDRCLNFHKLETPVTSASAGQVSYPLNDRSIGLSRNYSRELKVLVARLDEAGIYHF